MLTFKTPPYNTSGAKETIFIAKVNTIKVDEGSFYFIHLLNNALNPPSTSTIVTNWNNGIIPSSEYYKINLVKIMNDMIKVDGISCDVNKNVTGSVFSGWLSLNDIEILEKL